ncbi:MAG: hypothetical protein LBH49_02405 [Puniceicoccales bacterium]|jgi:hypothetical protein|nr:hypothetical protein [Puniceicoccales bacterium]
MKIKTKILTLYLITVILCHLGSYTHAYYDSQSEDDEYSEDYSQLEDYGWPERNSEPLQLNKFSRANENAFPCNFIKESYKFKYEDNQEFSKSRKNIWNEIYNYIAFYKRAENTNTEPIDRVILDGKVILKNETIEYIDIIYATGDIYVSSRGGKDLEYLKPQTNAKYKHFHGKKEYFSYAELPSSSVPLIVLEHKSPYMDKKVFYTQNINGIGNFTNKIKSTKFKKIGNIEDFFAKEHVPLEPSVSYGTPAFFRATASNVVINSPQSPGILSRALKGAGSFIWRNKDKIALIGYSIASNYSPFMPLIASGIRCIAGKRIDINGKRIHNMVNVVKELTMKGKKIIDRFEFLKKEFDKITGFSSFGQWGIYNNIKTIETTVSGIVNLVDRTCNYKSDSDDEDLKDYFGDEYCEGLTKERRKLINDINDLYDDPSKVYAMDVGYLRVILNDLKGPIFESLINMGKNFSWMKGSFRAKNDTNAIASNITEKYMIFYLNNIVRMTYLMIIIDTKIGEKEENIFNKYKEYLKCDLIDEFEYNEEKSDASVKTLLLEYNTPELRINRIKELTKKIKRIREEIKKTKKKI